MYKTSLKLISALLIVLFPYSLMGQQAEAPVYEDGDWWRVKIEFEFKYGSFRSGECYESYPEYLVKIEQGNPKVYGISRGYQEEIDCPEIKDEVLGKGRSKRLKFPMNLGLTWTGRGIREEEVEMRRGFMTLEVDYDIDHKVLAWEKVQTLKGVYDAFKIRESRYENYGSTYFYSPTVKAIVLQVANLEWVDRKVILVDFSLGSDRKRLEAPQIAKQPEVAPPPQVAKPRRVTLPPIPQRGGKRFAVLIGIGDYQNSSVPDLAYAAADARSIYDLLTDPSRGGFSKENVKLLLGREATRRNIVAAIGSWLFRRAGPDDEVFVYYAGHGAVETDRTGMEPDGLAKYLVPADAVPQELFVTGISNSELARMFQALKTKRLVFFLDSCYSAGTTGLGRALTATGFRAGSLSSDVYGSLAGSGQAIVAAAKPNQVALELPKLSHGLFTKFVLDGLQGEADMNGDGQVTLLELYPYLSKEVPKVARQEGGVQEPVLRSSISGDLVLSSVPETLRKLSIETRIDRLKKLYTEGTISAKQLDKAVQILKSGQSNRMLEDFFKGEISTSTFKDLF